MSDNRLFIIAPTFPPSSLPPAQRMRLMVPYLKDLGLYPTVYTVHHKCREEEADNWLLESCGENFELITLGALNKTICRFFGIGDVSLRLMPFLFFRLIKDALKKKPKFMLYPVPPWYILIIAPIVKKLTGIPYGIDYIDPWVKNKLTFRNSKEKITQKMAIFLESWVINNASLFYSVSNEINSNILKRYDGLKIPNFVVPYGVEQNDFVGIESRPNKTITLRYIGAVWPLASPVLDRLFKAFSDLVKDEFEFKVDFIGSSYTKVSNNQGHLKQKINSFNLESIVQENPNRVKYQDALKLTKSADILFLFGDTGKEYAASKLMGLLASKKPFFAFLHEESFPYKLLKSISFPYLVSYQSDGNNIMFKENDLVEMLKAIMHNYQSFIPFDFDRIELKDNTAKGMTEKIVKEIKKVIQ